MMDVAIEKPRTQIVRRTTGIVPVSETRDGRPIYLDRNFVMFGEDPGKLNALVVYEPGYITVVGEGQWEGEEEFLRKCFSRKMVNCLDYINEITGGFQAFVDSSRGLNFFLGRISRDVENGKMPFKYGAFLTLNTKNVRRYGR